MHEYIYINKYTYICIIILISYSVTAMAEIVKEGKARHIGLSEASADNIRKAQTVAPIYCIEQVYMYIYMNIHIYMYL
jgi:aryl-alcohol dehydrogenase-like predicted oxidoreductase